jgi:(1->4)-alpha-D-glucan 1-alpha-D-glucosylmutase
VGVLADRLVAFGRRTERETIVVVVPRLVAGLLQNPELPCLASDAWGDTRLQLPPAYVGRRLLNHLTERPVPGSPAALAAAAALGDLPVALLVTL